MMEGSANSPGGYAAHVSPPDLLSSPNDAADPATSYVQMEDGRPNMNVIGSSIGGSPSSTLEYMHSTANTGARSPQHAGGMVHFDSIALDKSRADEQHRIGGMGAAGGDSGDRDEEHQTYADPSILSSVLTVDCISDPVGFYVVCLVVLIGDMSRGCMFPTLWPLVESVGGNSVTLGYAVAAFSFGRILVSPVFGSWSHRYGYTLTLALSVTIILAGTLLYAQVVNIGRVEFLVFAQMILGVGSGTLGVTRAFVADVTPTRNRTTYMAWLTAVQYAGFTVTPLIGAGFYRFFSQEGRGIYYAGIFVLNKYTAPAYFMGLMCIINLVLIAIFFRDRTRLRNDSGMRKSKKQLSIDDFAMRTTSIGITVYDACILGCLLLNASTKGSIASFETLGVAFAASHFGLESSVAGSIVGTCGTLGVVALLSMGRLAKIMTDIQMIVGGMIVMVISVASLLGLEEGDNGDNPTWRYWLSMILMYSIAYPIGHTAVIGLFSKIVGRRPQGTLLGWFASAGSAARIVFPLMSGYVTQLASINVVFIILCVVLSLSILFTMLARETLENLIR